jgi:RNA polymerase sigma-70 factor, ECF subfamily
MTIWQACVLAGFLTRGNFDLVARHIPSVAEHAIPLGDLVLVDRWLGGEEAAARELFRDHQGRVHATLYRVLGGSRELDDLVQETFIQVFRSLRGFRGEARLSTWIDRIAVRVAYRSIARRKAQPLLVEIDPEAGDHQGSTPGAGSIDPRRQAAAREAVRRFYAALAELGPASRVAFALFAIDGRSLVEVAEAMNASVAATKLRIWRARRALAKRAAADPVLAEFMADGAEEETR